MLKIRLEDVLDLAIEGILINSKSPDYESLMARMGAPGLKINPKDTILELNAQEIWSIYKGYDYNSVLLNMTDKDKEFNFSFEQKMRLVSDVIKDAMEYRTIDNPRSVKLSVALGKSLAKKWSELSFTNKPSIIETITVELSREDKYPWFKNK